MRLRMLLSVLAVLLVTTLAAPAVAVLPAGKAPVGCARADLAAAAAALVHPAAEVAEVDQVAGLESALVLEPLIHPGTRHRLVRGGDLWCSAEGFNAAWTSAGRTAGTAEQAAAFASIAAAPYFDGVSVNRAVATATGAVVVDTHARTNGVTATWTVLLDNQGVRTADWTATGFAVAPFEAEIEGVTALPGLVRTYARNALGAVVAQQKIKPPTKLDNPWPFTAVEMSDEFTIEVHLSETPLGPNLGLDTGVTTVDYIRIMADTAEENYEQFLEWGFERDWRNAPTPYPHGGTPDIGMIYVDDAITQYCLACVWIRDDFQIHMSSQVIAALGALGYSYPGASDRDILSNIIGHEMFHNLQNSYGKPSRNGWPGGTMSAATAFSEGTARMQETAHEYSHISHQPQSLVYANDSNGCNGWDGSNRDAAFATGPFTSKTYNACYFWLTYYGNHGPEKLIDLLAAMHDHIQINDASEESFAAMEQATGPVIDDLLQFAASSLTGTGYTWAAGNGAGEALDWSRHLDRWRPATLAVGGDATATLRNGGMIAREVTAAGRPWVDGEAELAVVRADADGVTATLYDGAEPVAAPAAGEQVWIVAIRPGLGQGGVTLGHAAP